MRQNQPYSGKNKKIGVLGGTFNPIHAGHMHMANAAMKYLGLDKVVFMVCGIPPHKDLDYSTPANDRLNMLSLAIKNNHNYYIDDYEATINEKAYSYISLERIHENLDLSSELYFIIGADSLMHLDKWRHPEKLLSLCRFAVIPRGSYTKAECEKKISQLIKAYGGEIV